MSLYEMRQSYKLGSLLEKDIAGDPMVQFRTWLNEAMQGNLPDWVEANAMTLSTSDGHGRVTSRVVLLKGLDDGKFWFYTNYRSQKAQQIESNPNVSLCFLWQHVQRQVRIEGTATKAPRDQSVGYFRKRPHDSQLGAVVSQQSSVIDSRDVLEKRLDELKKQYADKEIPCPDDWGGYGVSPNRIEFWQGRESRLHDRLCYRKQASAWIVERLSP
ncbi:Pyridoxine/pyridoxamine 5'-phosphate oxidase [Stieleria neptunia]|uniref:Pyridoxine/pyridoxamine 5'-phosphate oxidase n=1 Tax=Stieleria neptunia TaxID=2527979 RepID=A0A518I3X8_9BACT|nr:pyridoxamine 5'-phosphate oxidase [Stieleria neptunia]QDV47748.1 Pyridoxine/pyridoxamine 5'-phosphate oxidase [Stieleria neptunia]